MQFFRNSVLTLIIIFSVTVLATTTQAGEIKKSFSDVTRVEIKTVSGDCIVEKGTGKDVKVVVLYTYNDDDFEARLEQRGQRLVLREKFYGHTNRGSSTWKVSVPDNIDIRFSTASGDFEIENLKCSVEASTASGNLQLRNMTGDFDMSTASGDIEARSVEGNISFSTASGDIDIVDIKGESEMNTASGNIMAEKVEGFINYSAASGNVDVRNSIGKFELSAASGDVDAEAIIITERSSFNVASGDVKVRLGKDLNHDIIVSAASGDAVLDFNGLPIKGFIEMTAKARGGRIRAPFKFDDEETHYKWDHEYVTKTVTKGSDRPRIVVRTASGKAVLQK